MNDVFSMLAVWTLSDLVLQPWVHLLFTLKKFIMKSFLVWNIYFTFLYQGLITLFCKNNFMEMWLLKHGFQNQSFPKYTENLTCDSSFWNIAGCKIPTMLRQRGLDKKFQDNIHAKDNFLKLLKFVCRCPADVPRTSHDLVPGTFHNWVP